MTGLVARVRGVPSWQLALGVALLALGFLIALQLRAQAPITRYSSSELPPLRDTARQLQAQQGQLRAEITSLRSAITAAEQRAAGNDSQVAALDDQLQQARVAAGLVALEGPGVVLNVDDSTRTLPPGAAAGDYVVSAGDLRDLVALLWLAGAEAIDVNGERVAPTTAITDIGASILINSAYLQPPYQLGAIGPKDLYDRLTSEPGWLAFVATRVQGVGIQLGVLTSDKVVVQAFSGPTALSEAMPLASPSPSSTPGGAP